MPFEVLGNPHAAYVVIIADNTTAAYNDWGGYSLYHGPDGLLQSRANKVSFDRPALGWRQALMAHVMLRLLGPAKEAAPGV